MISTTVPAQVTTVEDKITGNLSVSQLLLLTLPVLGGGLLFVMFPPFLSYAEYKIVLTVCFVVLCCTLALRIKGKVLVVWLVLLVRFYASPRYYVFDKNDHYLREPISDPVANKSETKESPSLRQSAQPLEKLTTAELVKIEEIMASPEAKLHYKTNRKGKLYVHITDAVAEDLIPTAN